MAKGFGLSRAVIGMVHVGALPGTPFSRRGRAGRLEAIDRVAVEEARVLVAAGFDGVIVENMHDRPYVHGVKPPEIVACMTRLTLAVRRAVDEAAAKRRGDRGGSGGGVGRPMLGVQVLSGGNMEAIAIAHACGADFIRCENFVFSHVADEGLLERAEAGALLRYRAAIGAEGVRVFADIKKKHASHAITGDVTIGECAEAAAFFGADGVIVTGTATGKAASMDDVAEVRAATRLPVLVGSGVTPETVGELFEHADALIVGSFIKRGGVWSNGIDARRCEAIVRARDSTRRRAS